MAVPGPQAPRAAGGGTTGSARRDGSADEVKVLVRNRRARHEYFVEETLEAGIALVGSEVKSLREAHASIAEAWAVPREGEVFVVGMQINEYPFATHFQHQPKRDRRLLLHKKEIARLGAAVREKGYTLVLLEVYLRRGRVKVLLGLCKGKQLHDKRDAERERDAKKEIERALRRRR